MILRAVARHKVADAMSIPSEQFKLVGIGLYNTLFTNSVDVVPLAEPDDVLQLIAARLAGVCDIASSEWVEDFEGEYAVLRVYLTEHGN